MRAAVYRRYGPPEVVQIEDRPTPTPGPHDLRLAVKAATVSAADWRLRSGAVPRGFGLLLRLAFGVFGPRKPVLGVDMAGVVEAVGDQVQGFQIGDRVFAMSAARLGGHSEQALVDSRRAVAHTPARLTDAQAVALAFGGTAALHFLRDKGQLQPGERVLINGASGAVGCAAVQIARHLGAHVTAVCSAANAELVRGLGAEAVIDYQTEDFATGGAQYDLILDTVGTCTRQRCQPALAEGGRLLLVVATLGQTLGAAISPTRGGRIVRAGVAPERAEALQQLAAWAEEGVYRPHISATYPLDDIVEAYRRVDSGRKQGSVVITME